MADPVEQIFLQAQAGSADGAGFGEFFQRGQELEQRKQKLDIDREQTRIANTTLELRLREGEAKQLTRVAELEQDTLFTQNYAAWISQGAEAKHIPQMMGLVNGTSANHAVVGQFFERVKGIREVEASELQATASLRQAREFEAKTGQPVRGASIGPSGTTVRVGSSDVNLTSTERNLQALENAKQRGDLVAVKALEEDLRLDELSPAQAAVYKSKLNAINDRKAQGLKLLQASLYAQLDPDSVNAKSEELITVAAEAIELLTAETFNKGLGAPVRSRPTNDTPLNFDPTDPDNLFP